jgi:hypothetical protein
MPCAAVGPLISEQPSLAGVRVRTPPGTEHAAPPPPPADEPDDAPHPRWGLSSILWSPTDMVRGREQRERRGVAAQAPRTAEKCSYTSRSDGATAPRLCWDQPSRRAEARHA